MVFTTSCLDNRNTYASQDQIQQYVGSASGLLQMPAALKGLKLMKAHLVVYTIGDVK